LKFAAAVFRSVLRYAKDARTKESKEVWDAWMALIFDAAAFVQAGGADEKTRMALFRVLETVAVVCCDDKVRCDKWPCD
jgi:hypothetical protein